ncbi:hypothetical protein ACJH6H_26515 [Mycobacterium sp. SMC-21]|uniref:hypothetical protein n=1 Tax=Mycobacterium sp. SMC-21 TaxID=3381632 RepID=UPI0038775846
MGAAYAGALEVSCSSCGADVDQYCTTPDGRLRRCPCVTRCTSIPAELRSAARETDSDVAQGHSAPQLVFVDLDAHDPSEPRHPRGDE